MEKLEFPFKYNRMLLFVYLLFSLDFFYGEGDQTVTKIAQSGREVSIIEGVHDPMEDSPD